MKSVVAKSLDITNLKYDHLNWKFPLENLPTINCELDIQYQVHFTVFQI